MMLDMILPTTTSLSRPSSTSLSGDGQTGLPDSRGANVFAQLLLQASGDAQEPLPTVTMPWPNEAGLGDRQLLAQMIAENSGFAAPAVEAPIAEALRKAINEEAALHADDHPPSAAELAEVAELMDNLVAAPQLTAATQATSNAIPVMAGATSQIAPPSVRPEAVLARAEAAPLQASNPNPMGATPASAAVATFDIQAVQAPLSGEAPLGQSVHEPLSAVGVAQPNSAANTLAAAQAAQSPSLTAPLNTPAWGRELGQQVVFAARADEQQVSLRLNPANLGPLQIELKVLDQQAQVQFLSPHAQVRGAVEQAIPQLREALAEQGITLADTSVGEQRQQQHDTHSDRRSSPSAHDIAEAQNDETAIVAESAQPLADGRINVYV